MVVMYDVIHKYASETHVMNSKNLAQYFYAINFSCCVPTAKYSLQSKKNRSIIMQYLNYFDKC